MKDRKKHKGGGRASRSSGARRTASSRRATRTKSERGREQRPRDWDRDDDR